MSWRLARSLTTLLNQVNTLSPNRDKSSDGTIGDARHAASKSEHNPDVNGIVRAMDVSNDPGHNMSSQKLAEALVASRDPRIKYIISNRKICSGANESQPAWKWRSYGGSNPHDHHVHISVVSDPQLYDSTSPWSLPGFDGKTAPAASAVSYKGIVATVFGGGADPNKSAYDGSNIDDTVMGVALPFRFKSARPLVKVTKDGKSVICKIVDVGPWNIDDPYWTTGKRPQAESGTDNRGRKTNKAGIDLTPAAAKAIGLEGKGIVDWEFVGVQGAANPKGGAAGAGGVLAGAGGAIAGATSDPSHWVLYVSIGAAVVLAGLLYWWYRHRVAEKKEPEVVV